MQPNQINPIQPSQGGVTPIQPAQPTFSTPATQPSSTNPFLTPSAPTAPAPTAAPAPIAPVAPAPTPAQTPTPVPAPAPAPTASPAQQMIAPAPGAATPQSQSQTPTPAATISSTPNMQTARGKNVAPTTPEGQANRLAAQAAARAKHDNPNSSQASLMISELRDSMVIMKDGSFRAVITCKSINYDLMSEEERESVEYAYQNFLNSLNFTIQILIRSQRVDIAPYIDRLINLRRQNDNMLLGVLMDDYIDFIDTLSQEANIMDKSFFIIIPYYTSKEAEKALEQSKNFFKTFTKDKTPPITRIDRATYDKAVTEINNRCEAIVSGLYQIGIQSVRLNTKELGQLYYNFNNPDTAVNEPLGDFNKLAHLYVKKGQKGEEN